MCEYNNGGGGLCRGGASKIRQTLGGACPKRLKTPGLWWCFYQQFGLSFWLDLFTALDPLMSKWCSAKFIQIYIFNGLKVSTYSANVHFWVNYFPLRMFQGPASQKYWARTCFIFQCWITITVLLNNEYSKRSTLLTAIPKGIWVRVTVCSGRC